MTSVSYRRLRPPPREVPVDPDQCEVGIDDNMTSPLRRDQQRLPARRARYRDWSAYQCQKQAVYEIDGRKVCGIHAGKIALAERLGEPLPVKFGPGRRRSK